MKKRIWVLIIVCILFPIVFMLFFQVYARKSMLEFKAQEIARGMGERPVDMERLKAMMEGLGGRGPAQIIFPGNLPDRQSEGARLFTHYCTQCHALPDPQLHTPQEWPEVVHRMIGHIQVLGGFEPSASEVNVLLAYLIRFAGSPEG